MINFTLEQMDNLLLLGVPILQHIRVDHILEGLCWPGKQIGGKS